MSRAGDLFSFPDDQLSMLIASGVVEPIADQEKVKSENLAEAIYAVSYQDTVYAYLYTADNGYFLYYNKKYLSENDVMTFDGLLKAAEAADKKVSMEFDSGWYMYSFFGNTGLEVGINEDGVTNHCNWNATDTPIKGVDVAKAMQAILASPAFIPQPDSGFIEGIKNDSVIAGMMDIAKTNSDIARTEMGKAYTSAKFIATIISIISAAALLVAFYIVFKRVVSPVTMAKNEITEIIAGLDAGEGDLTKRITLRYNDEISDLGNGINKFMDKLQEILRMIITNSREMEVVVNEVQDSVIHSNESASDLSAVTEELSATMQEVGNSAGAINVSTEDVRSEVDNIYVKTTEMNNFTKEMRANAEEMEHNATKNRNETSSKVSEILDVLQSLRMRLGNWQTPARILQTESRKSIQL